MLISEYSSSGRQVSLMVMEQRETFFNCIGGCGREHLSTFAPNKKYCERRSCQATKELRERERHNKRRIKNQKLKGGCVPGFQSEVRVP